MAIPASTQFEESPTAAAAAGLDGRHVAVVIFSHYPSDPRPRRAAEALVRCGIHVDVISLRGETGGPAHTVLNGVNIRFLPIDHQREGKLAYVWQYAAFLVAAFALLTVRAFHRRYDLVHVHNMPDVLVFSALVQQLLGARVILDLHDPMPELMTTIFGQPPDAPTTVLLKLLERWSIALADEVITVNAPCKRIFSGRACAAEKIHVIMNTPDPALFSFRAPSAPTQESRTADRRCVIMYHGSLVERHGLDLAVTALARIKPLIPQAELRVFGKRTPFLERVLSTPAAIALGDSLRYLGERRLEHIVDEIRACDIGIIPNRLSLFTEINTPTRIFEYLSQGKPVIAPRTRGILDYFGAEDLFYFDAGDAAGLARQIVRVHRQPDLAYATVLRGQSVWQQHNWPSECGRFIKLVARLLGPAGRTRDGALRPAATPGGGR